MRRKQLPFESLLNLIGLIGFNRNKPLKFETPPGKQAHLHWAVLGMYELGWSKKLFIHHDFKLFLNDMWNWQQI